MGTEIVYLGTEIVYPCTGWPWGREGTVLPGKILEVKLTAQLIAVGKLKTEAWVKLRSKKVHGQS